MSTQLGQWARGFWAALCPGRRGRQERMPSTFPTVTRSARCGVCGFRDAWPQVFAVIGLKLPISAHIVPLFQFRSKPAVLVQGMVCPIVGGAVMARTSCRRAGGQLLFPRTGHTDRNRRHEDALERRRERTSGRDRDLRVRYMPTPVHSPDSTFYALAVRK
jgi:hypothetical protein